MGRNGRLVGLNLVWKSSGGKSRKGEGTGELYLPGGRLGIYEGLSEPAAIGPDANGRGDGRYGGKICECSGGSVNATVVKETGYASEACGLGVVE